MFHVYSIKCRSFTEKVNNIISPPWVNYFSSQRTTVEQYQIIVGKCTS